MAQESERCNVLVLGWKSPFCGCLEEGGAGKCLTSWKLLGKSLDCLCPGVLRGSPCYPGGGTPSESPVQQCFSTAHVKRYEFLR